jgi:hypothetical protein
MSIGLSRHQRRQMHKLADAVDRVTQADRRFFERFPDRRHRVRLASQAEILQYGIVLGVYPTAPHGFEHYVAVKNLTPGCRMRVPFTGPAGNDTDISEREAAWLYDTRSNARSREIEAQMLEIMEARA